VGELCERFELTDPFRILHPDVRDFTYNPSGSIRKNRSRIDFFLVSNDLITRVNSCTQGFCNKTFDHKPIFLSFKRKKIRSRPIVHNSTVDNVMAQHIVKLAVHKTTLLAVEGNLGMVTEAILEEELIKLNDIEAKINRIILIKGKVTATVAGEEMEDELRNLEAELLEDWDEVATLDYLNGFGKKVPADIFFEQLISGSRDALLQFQNSVKFSENEARRAWLEELAELKKGNVLINSDRITELEGFLNDSSERAIKNRIGTVKSPNFVTFFTQNNFFLKKTLG
jgi:hypothetical protein